MDFCRRHGIRRLAVFGSALREDFRPDSDVDVLVEFAPGRVPGYLTLAGLEEELTAIVGRPVDMNTAAGLPSRFRSRVAAEAEVLYAA